LILALALAGGGTSRAQTADPAGMYEFGGGKLDGLGVSEANDAGLYLLGAYSIEKAERNARLLPGLSGVAKQVQGAQKAHMPLEGKFGYSLADALVDALWRKQVVDSLYRNPDGSLYFRIADGKRRRSLSSVCRPDARRLGSRKRFQTASNCFRVDAGIRAASGEGRLYHGQRRT
jgi:hypothetical protein